jgi:alpha-beta hydrolase superfamily lysophospholipase
MSLISRLNKQKVILLLGLHFNLAAQVDYKKDVLGDAFEQATIQQPDDYEGKVTCTLVKRKDAQSKIGVLYIHGFSDYFFQAEMADKFAKQGFAFYALDLRKYGRSHLQNQKICNVRNLNEYFADIDTALSIMHHEGVDKILISGHSTGGLIVTLYANQRIGKELFDAVYLNSPFYDMNLNPILKKVVLPLVVKKGAKKPEKLMKGGLSPWYGMSIYYKDKGEWQYNLDWKPHNAPSVNYGWLKAIYDGQKQIHRGLKMSKPTLVMHSNNSVYTNKWIDEMLTGDAVLNVKHIERYASKLEGNVKVQSIENGMHDLILSKKAVRDSVYEQLFKWLIENLERENG